MTIAPFMHLAVACLVAAWGGGVGEIRQGDAFVRADSGSQTWTIGTASVEMTYSVENERLRLTGFRNKLGNPPCEYAAPSVAFGEGDSSAGTFAIDTVWSKTLAPGKSVDPAEDGVRLAVKKDELIGFGAATYSDDAGAAVGWPVTVDYGDGNKFASANEAELALGPVWYYYILSPGTGYMDPLTELLPPASPGAEKVRVPGGYRGPAECCSLSATTFRLVNAYEVMRVWKAPQDGVVTIQGAAQHAGGSPNVCLRIYRVYADRAEHPVEPNSAPHEWKFVSGSSKPVVVGGRPAVELEFALRNGGLSACLHIQAYPGTSILRQWVELENATAADVPLDSSALFSLALPGEALRESTLHWMYGGTSRPNQGVMESAPIPETYHRALLGDRTDNYVPWMAITQRKGSAPGGGVFLTLDHLGTWMLALDVVNGSGQISASLPELEDRTLGAGQRIYLPKVTLGVFDGELDDMGRRVYDWQYAYLWDYTNNDFFARTKWTVPWFFCSRNLQEQFAARLAWLDMQADLMRTMGMELLWDDAGWSKYPGWPIADSYAVVFSPSYEGPDYAETLRYFGKMDMTWLLWMAGRPTAGMLDTKVGSWGNFQWRTDGFGRFSLQGDHAVRAQIEHFLQANPRCSFHTCCGGSRYAHEFEVQRYADVNYLSDMGRGEETNHYFSYLEVPDKWVDLLDAMLQPESKYNPETGPGLLSMTPGWYLRAEPPEQEPLRRMMEIYRYLRQEGVAGRWTHMMHPAIKGDKDFQYDQRISYDGKKAVIIPKRRPKDEVTIYPKGLIADYDYAVGFESTKQVATRSGADLMANGVTLTNCAPGEIVFLGLPGMPGFGLNAASPQAPGKAFVRNETNIGHSGVGIYWSPGADANWISYYEIRRGEEVVGKTCIGTYYFDHSPGWNAASTYAVRTVNGEGKASEWTVAEALSDAAPTYAALGGLFAESGRDGWSAESSADGQAFAGMTWVAPAKSPAGDRGGTPNQPGGVEGYWEGPGQARVGRGWQQASPEVACVRVWTAPAPGKVTVIGRAMKECYHVGMGNPLHVKVLRNAEQVWPGEGWAEVPLNDLRGITHDFSLDVAAGDVLRFVLDRGASQENDLLAWMPRIVYAHETPAREESCVRILCGAKDAYTDRTGNIWSADANFSGGEAAHAETDVADAAPTADDQALYRSARTGRDFSYAIPVKPGLYTLRLKFAETKYAWAYARPFDIFVNGRCVLENFDICQAAHGPNRAYERFFHNIVADANGQIKLRLTGGVDPLQETDEARLSAIEIVPESRPTIQIDAGAPERFVDWNGFAWTADADFDGGSLLASQSAVQHASPTLYDQALYQTARSGNAFQYVIPAPPGLYTVHLKFAELWLTQPGQRPMQVAINGRVVRDNWDPASAAGQVGMAADFRVEGIAPDAHGNIRIAVRATGANDAILQGIEIE